MGKHLDIVYQVCGAQFFNVIRRMDQDTISHLETLRNPRDRNDFTFEISAARCMTYDHNTGTKAATKGNNSRDMFQPLEGKAELQNKNIKILFLDNFEQRRDFSVVVGPATNYSGIIRGQQNVVPWG